MSNLKIGTTWTISPVTEGSLLGSAAGVNEKIGTERKSHHPGPKDERGNLKCSLPIFPYKHCLRLVFFGLAKWHIMFHKTSATTRKELKLSLDGMIFSDTAARMLRFPCCNVACIGYVDKKFHYRPSETF